VIAGSCKLPSASSLSFSHNPSAPISPGAILSSPFLPRRGKDPESRSLIWLYLQMMGAAPKEVPRRSGRNGGVRGLAFGCASLMADSQELAAKGSEDYFFFAGAFFAGAFFADLAGLAALAAPLEEASWTTA
jgi:hypothetical protein